MSEINVGEGLARSYIASDVHLCVLIEIVNLDLLELRDVNEIIDNGRDSSNGREVNNFGELHIGHSENISSDCESR
jgi:hypothetical protein